MDMSTYFYLWQVARSGQNAALIFFSIAAALLVLMVVKDHVFSYCMIFVWFLMFAIISARAAGIPDNCPGLMIMESFVLVGTYLTILDELITRISAWKGAANETVK